MQSLLLVGQVVGELLLEFIVHPLNARKSAVALLALRRSASEIHNLAKQIFRHLTLLFNKQRQLPLLFRRKGNPCVSEYLDSKVS